MPVYGSVNTETSLLDRFGQQTIPKHKYVQCGKAPWVSREFDLNRDLCVGSSSSTMQHHLPHSFHVPSLEMKPHGHICIISDLRHVMYRSTCRANALHVNSAMVRECTIVRDPDSWLETMYYGSSTHDKKVRHRKVCRQISSD